MKRTLIAISSAILVLASVPLVKAAQNDDELFIYTLPEYDDSSDVSAIDERNVKIDTTEQQPKLKLDYEVPCDLKCSIGHTGLFLLYIAAEGQAGS